MTPIKIALEELDRAGEAGEITAVLHQRLRLLFDCALRHADAEGALRGVTEAVRQAEAVRREMHDTLDRWASRQPTRRLPVRGR